MEQVHVLDVEAMAWAHPEGADSHLTGDAERFC
jgi:hypothetical protein